MKKRAPVSTIMTENPVTLRKDQGLLEAEKVFREYKIRHLPVVSSGKLEGILSLTDLQRISFADHFDEEGDVDTAIYTMLSLEQVMVSKPKAVQHNATIRDVAEILSKHEFHALPVLDGDKLVGIVTTTDLIRYLVDQF